MSLPLLFTLPPSSRHDIILLDPSQPPALKQLNQQISIAIASSPNCAEFMAQYKAKTETDAAQKIGSMKMRWVVGEEKRSKGSGWPESTILTEANLPAILKFLERDPTMGVLEITLGDTQ